MSGLVMTFINNGLKHHNVGDYKRAIDSYDQALEIEPYNSTAMNLKSNAVFSTGNVIEAISLANQAISIEPNNSEFYNNRGLIFLSLSKFTDSESDFKRALKINPTLVEALNNLSILYRRQGNTQKSIKFAENAITLRPDFAEAYASLGAALFNSGDYEKSEAALKNSVAINPGMHFATHDLIKVEYKLEKFESAISLYFEYTRLHHADLQTDFAIIHSLNLLGRTDEACDIIIKSISRDNPEIAGLSNVLEQDIFFGQLVSALQYIVAVMHKPQIAIDIYKISLEYADGVAHALWVNLGSLYFALHRIEDAIDANTQALRANENQLWAYNNLGVCYISRGESKKAIEVLSRAVAIDPNHAAALGWLLKEKCHICDWSGYDQLRSKVDSLRFTNNTSPISAFTALAVYNDPDALLYWARLSANEIFNRSVCSASTLIQHPTLPSTNKIRLGYYSFDFRNHPVAHLICKLFELHDRDRFEIFVYSYGPDDGSDIRERIKSAADKFIDVKDLPSIEIAQKIASDSIDFLIDLTGNTQHNRSDVFGMRPSKFQAHWLGFIGTMGSRFYDFIIADEIVIPKSDEIYFDERILRLPNGFHVNDNAKSIAKNQFGRLHYGLPESCFVFASFCQTFKIQPEIFDSWVNILKRVERSVLWLASGPDGALDNLRQYAATKGLDPNRIVEAERCGMEEYLSRFSIIDLFLDAFPYTSGTVASDCLLSGCPLLTLSGNTMVSRQASSILTYGGLPELVAHSYKEYEQRAVSLATTDGELQRLRVLLMRNIQDKTLLDTKKIVKALEEEVACLLM